MFGSRELSPLLAVFAGWPVQRKMIWVDPHQCIVTATQSFAHLVDAGSYTVGGGGGGGSYLILSSFIMCVTEVKKWCVFYLTLSSFIIKHLHRHVTD